MCRYLRARLSHLWDGLEGRCVKCLCRTMGYSINAFLYGLVFYAYYPIFWGWYVKDLQIFIIQFFLRRRYQGPVKTKRLDLNQPFTVSFLTNEEGQRSVTMNGQPIDSSHQLFKASLVILNQAVKAPPSPPAAQQSRDFHLRRQQQQQQQEKEMVSKEGIEFASLMMNMVVDVLDA